MTERWIIYTYNRAFEKTSAGTGYIELSPNANQTWKIQFISLKKYNYAAGRNLKIYCGGRSAALTYYKIFETDTLDNEEIYLPNEDDIRTFGCVKDNWILNFPSGIVFETTDMTQLELIGITMHILTNEIEGAQTQLSRFGGSTLTKAFGSVWKDE